MAGDKTARGIWTEWKNAGKIHFPGEGRVETFLDHLASTNLCSFDEILAHRKRARVHPWLYRPAMLALGFMGWWHYHIQRNSCKDGSRICWEPDHWHNGKIGPVAQELLAQLRELDG